MPRTRSLKPSFFTDAELALFPPLHRIAFEGLWVWADRRGVLDDKPRELKVQILPFDSADFDSILTDLCRPKSDGSPGFIRRYQVGGKRFIHIRKFLAHQNPHLKETKFSHIPDPPEEALDEPGLSPGKPGAEPEQAPGQSAGNGNGNGSLVLGLGSGSLVVGGGSQEPPAANPLSAMSALSIPAVVAGAEPDKRAQGSPMRHVPAIPEKPTKPDDSWDGDDFIAWMQTKRFEEGFPPDKRHARRFVCDWFNAALMAGFVLKDLRLGFCKFGGDPYWLERSLPIAGFVAQWGDYVQKSEVKRAS